MSIRLIALDLDGTLLDPGGHIHSDTLKLLDEFAASDRLIALNTGRQCSDIYRLMETNEVYPERPYPHAIIAQERELYIRSDNGEFEPWQPWNDDIVKAETELLPVARQFVAQLEERLASEHITPRPANTHLENSRGFVERYFANRIEAQRAHQLANELLPDDSPLQVFRNSSLIALRHRDTGKGKLLLQCARLLEIAPQHIMAVGDSHNDLEMLDGVLGFQSATVDNADADIKEAVKKASGTVATLPRSRGVGQIIRGLL